MRLTLYSMKNCQDVLPLHQFPFLKTLRLNDVPSLEYISLMSKSVNLPPLELLKIMNCPNLKGWWERSDTIKDYEDDDNNYGEISMIKAKNHSLPSFSHLSTLHIYGCPELSSMPLFPYVEELDLENSNLIPLEQTISMGVISMASQENTTAAVVAESTSSTRYSSSSTLATLFTPLSKLKSLRIILIKGSDGHVLQSIQHLTALQELSLSNYIGDGMELEWQGLRKLQYLSLCDHPKLASLPVGLQQATSLRHLTISNCPSLTTIPKWICNIISLQSLEILHCANLTSLPTLTSLKKLEILDCPILVEGCKSEDWLAHIQNLKGDLALPKEEESSIEFHYEKQNSSSLSSLIV